MKNTPNLNDNVEFLDTSVKNWRWGKIINIKRQDNLNIYKIYSGTDIFWAKNVKVGSKTRLETV